MSKPVRFTSSISTSPVPSKTFAGRSSTNPLDFNQLVPIALFSGIGLLVSLVAVLCGVQGAWF